MNVTPTLRDRLLDSLGTLLPSEIDALKELAQERVARNRALRALAGLEEEAEANCDLYIDVRPARLRELAKAAGATLDHLPGEGTRFYSPSGYIVRDCTEVDE